MTCFSCNHDFCWLCLKDWSLHGMSTGGYYNCNIYTHDATKAREKGQQSE